MPVQNDEFVKELSQSDAWDCARSFAAVRGEILAAAGTAVRNVEDIKLVAVTKTYSASAVLQALTLGQRCFGENRVQEAASKYPALRADFPDIELHLIGPLQTNKVADAVALFDVIETIDRPKLAEAVAAALTSRGHRMKSCFIQVNTGEEPQKAGVYTGDADDFIRDCRDRLRLPVVGLMAIPPANDEPSLHFALLREIAKRHELKNLSMGMSGDFALAIQQGATHVRIGTALFGSRPHP